jgi:hypothetical protein
MRRLSIIETVLMLRARAPEDLLLTSIAATYIGRLSLTLRAATYITSDYLQRELPETVTVRFILRSTPEELLAHACLNIAS